MLETLYGIAELPTYIRLAEKLLSVEKRQDLINYLAEHPKSGDLVEGMGAEQARQDRDEGRSVLIDDRAGNPFRATPYAVSPAQLHPPALRIQNNLKKWQP